MKIAIAGGGIAGMSLAYYLTKSGHSVTVFEKEKTLGGLARSFPVSGNFLEEYYHHIFLTDTHTVELIKEAGLGDRMIWEESKMGLYCDGKVYPFGTPLDLFKFKPLSIADKVRFAYSTLYLMLNKNYQQLEKITAEEFLIKTAGKNAYEKIWEALLATKFGENYYKKVTAGWFQARVSSRGKSKKRLFEIEKLGYLDGSLKVLFDRLEHKVKERKGLVFRNCEIERVDIDGNNKIVVRLANADSGGVFDALSLCVPNPVIKKIAGHIFGKDYIQKHLDSTDYRAVLCVVLLIKGSLSPFYWINISQKGIPFTGLMEHTNLISKDRYNKNDIIYLSRYISQDEPCYNMGEAELIELYSKHIGDIFPGFNRAMIKESFIFKNLYAQPVVTKGHKERMPDIVSPIKNIFINNTTQIYPEDRGMSPGIKKSLELSGVINNYK